MSKIIGSLGATLLAATIAGAIGRPALAAGAETAPGPIAGLQARLAQLGYHPGPIDGVMSAKTERALLAYRHTGRPPIIAGPDATPIITAQRALQRLGFLRAPADGELGPQTRDAIVRFQAENRLPVDPRVSDRLLRDLDEIAQPAAAAGNPPASLSSPPSPPEATGREPLPPGVTPPPLH